MKFHHEIISAPEEYMYGKICHPDALEDNVQLAYFESSTRALIDWRGLLHKTDRFSQK